MRDETGNWRFLMASRALLLSMVLRLGVGKSLQEDRVPLGKGFFPCGQRCWEVGPVQVSSANYKAKYKSPGNRDLCWDGVDNSEP